MGELSIQKTDATRSASLGRAYTRALFLRLSEEASEAGGRRSPAHRWYGRGAMSGASSSGVDIASRPPPSLQADPDAEHDAIEYPFYDNEDSYSSDDELEWDPDRERLLRTLRQSSLGTAFSTVTGSPSTKSLAERRNEWRASRGLERQKSVQEIIAERRAQRDYWREEDRSAAALISRLNSPTAADRSAAAARAPPAPPSSANRALELRGGQAERARSLQGVPLGTPPSASTEEDSASLSTPKGKKKRNPWSPFGAGRTR